MYFKNKYRIPSARLQAWDYANEGFYFVTICTKNRILHFGDVVDKKMVLSEMGMIADKCWMDIPKHFPFVNLDKYIVMPNHVHGIIVIVETQNLASPGHAQTEMSAMRTTETQNLASPGLYDYGMLNIKMNSVPNQKICHPLSVDIKLV